LLLVTRQTFFFNSGISHIRTNSLGHSFSSSANHRGPECHVLFFKKAWGDCPLEIASAELSTDFTCRHSMDLSISYIEAMRLGGIFSQCNTIIESHQNTTRLGVISKAPIISRYNCVNNNAPESSNWGIVIDFSGAILDFAHNILMLVFPQGSLERTYMHAP